LTQVSSGASWQEYVCDDESSARLEAEKQTARDPDGAEWIYLRNGEERWVARRIPPGWAPPEPKPESMKRAFLTSLLNPFDWRP
jgi:hypothetical protein